MDIDLKRITEELKLQNKKKIDLTNHLGMVSSAFGNWVAGRNSSYKKYLHAIADFLGVSVEDLKGETDIKEKPLSENEERLKELYELTKDLSEAEMVAFKAFLAGLKANRKPD